MFFSRSIAIDDEELGNVALAAGSGITYSTTETEFIERLKAGDADAFDTLANRYAADIYGLLYRLTQDAEEASDLTQETFLSALKAISKFRGEADLKTWLFRIAINESRNRFRWWKRRRRDATISLDVTVGDSETPLSDTFLRARRRRKKAPCAASVKSCSAQRFKNYLTFFAKPSSCAISKA